MIYNNIINSSLLTKYHKLPSVSGGEAAEREAAKRKNNVLIR
jgi:hypothetical protein